ncbi:hypothetical protein [Roseomonas sp. BN140053]|uniref:hypothetical protein n=1 Tax=Roseomonas sp. BN140053 TaxID=3391898 RepID=UPI0039E8AEEF
MPSHSLRRLLGLILPFLQIGVALLPLVGIGHSVGTMSAASPTPVIPAGYAFPTMWTVLFALSVAYGIWQFLPSRHDDPLAQQVGWPLAGAFAINVLWQAVAQFSARNGFHLVAIILVGLVCALVAFFAARNSAEPGWASRWIVRPLCGLLAGWLTAASFANISGAALAAGAIPASGFGASLAAVLVLLAAGGFAVAVAWAARGDLWYLGGVGWAFLAVVAANLGINRFDLFSALAAAAMLALVGAVTWQRRARAAVAARAPG